MPSLLLIALLVGVAAQEPDATLVVEVRTGDMPIEHAEVVVRGLTYRTDSAGRAVIGTSPGPLVVHVVAFGYAPASLPVTLAPATEEHIVVTLQPRPVIDEHVRVVAATRTNRHLEDQPMRVEVLEREEIEEKMLMTPGDIVMMLNEMGGMRVQATSPALGAASVRIQGMRGRYTRVLSDGLPLYGDVGGIGLLQIPPMDLGRVEVIKGVTSALYGAGAMGGVVNLLSRRPRQEAEREVLLNLSTRGASDAVGYVAGPFGDAWAGSLLASGHWHGARDLTGEGWADVPRYARGVLRPRIFRDSGGGQTFYGTIGVTYEDRSGGLLHPQLPHGPRPQALDTHRHDAGAAGQFLLRNRFVLTLKGAAVRQRHHHRFGDVVERDRHDTYFGEAALRVAAGRGVLVAGAALDRETYTAQDVPRFDYAFTVPGVFLQYDVDISPAVALSSSTRLDNHSEYGTFVSPRLSALLRRGRWTSRASIGTGFFPATPLTEETGAAGLSRLELAMPLRAERGVSASFDLSRTDGPVTYTATLFTSRITDPLHVDRSVAYAIGHLAEPTLNVGTELLGTLRREPFAVTAAYTYVRARETVHGTRDDVPLTPRHSAGIVGMWEEEDIGRIGVEWYYTGRQRLEQNPYRTVSAPYVIVGVLAERWLGPVALFVNGENLTNVRQTRWDSMLRPTRAVDGRWTVDAWAPLEGRTVNGGVRLRF